MIRFLLTIVVLFAGMTAEAQQSTVKRIYPKQEQKSENRTALPVGEGSPAGAPFWVLYKSAALLQNRPGIGFLWQKFTIPLFRDSANFWKCYER